MNIDLNLMSHQADFIEDITTRNLCLLGGYGCGKTFSLAIKLITLALYNAGHEGIALSPTYGMATKVLIPNIEEQLRIMQIPFVFNKSSLIFDIKAGGVTTKLHVMAAESYKRVAGINAAFFGIDEADLIQPDLALAAWQMLQSRLRKGNVYQGCAVSTPEGVGSFLQTYFEEDVREKPSLGVSRKIIRASTYDNPFLPKEYIQELEAQYPPHLIKAYLMGEFVNLNGKVVYYTFDKSLNHTDLTLDEVPMNETLFCGLDFNYAGMSFVAGVKRGDGMQLIDELVGARNTDECIQQIKERYKGRPILIHPDPAGNQRKTSASDTDIAMLRKAGLPVRVMSSHPLVKDRVSSVNAMFANGEGNRRLLVNTKACKWTTKSLVSQTYLADGKPDKKTTLGVNETLIDGPLDATGYLVYSHFPLRGGGSQQIRMTGS